MTPVTLVTLIVLEAKIKAVLALPRMNLWHVAINEYVACVSCVDLLAALGGDRSREATLRALILAAPCRGCTNRREAHGESRHKYSAPAWVGPMLAALDDAEIDVKALKRQMHGACSTNT